MEDSGSNAGAGATKEADEVVDSAQWALPGVDFSIAHKALSLSVFMDPSLSRKGVGFYRISDLLRGW